MSLENSFNKKTEYNYSEETIRLAKMFSELNEDNLENSNVFSDLENNLASQGFYLANDRNNVAQIFSNSSLICRSEKFSRVMDLLLEEKAITLSNTDNRANMCAVASGDGFKIAMIEGFSGKDVNSKIKTVVTFRGDHLDSREHLEQDSSLWQTKPETATMSLAGKGDIFREDLEMISFRIPVHLFPESLLNETEKDSIEEEGIKFITRHYIPNRKTTH